MPSPTRQGFLKLPAELRLQIYSHIIQSIGIPTSQNLRKHYGLLLSCWKVFHEVKYAALAAVGLFLAQIQENWKRINGNTPLHISKIKRLSDTIGIQIGIPAEFYEMSQFDEKVHLRCLAKLKPLLHSLVEHLPSFALYPGIFPIQVRDPFIPYLNSLSCVSDFIDYTPRAFWNANEYIHKKLSSVAVGQYGPFLSKLEVDSKRGMRMGARHPYGMVEWDCMWNPVLAARGRRNWNWVYLARKSEEDRLLRKLERESYGRRLIHACDDFRP